MDKLPETLGELLSVAMDDYEKVKNDPRYTVYMGYWHEPIHYGQKCAVCLAGSVMAKTMKFPISRSGTPSSISDDNNTSGKLSALDYLRTGQVSMAVTLAKESHTSECLIKADKLEKEHKSNIPRYINGEIDREAWEQSMYKLRDDLLEVGL